MLFRSQASVVILLVCLIASLTSAQRRKAHKLRATAVLELTTDQVGTVTARLVPIVILDEPSVGLDSRSSHLVGQALRRLMEGKTVILISHHLLSVEDVDRIIVIEGGRVVEEGTHDALLSRGGLYQALQRFQSRELLP